MNDCGCNSYNDMSYDIERDAYAYYLDLVESDYNNSVKNKKYL